MKTRKALLLVAGISAFAGAFTYQPGPKWGPAPAIFPAGAQMAVMQGDPTKSGEFVVRLRFPDGYRIPPHTHPTDEHVTVLEGMLNVGMGKTEKPDSMRMLHPGDSISMSKNQPHYASAMGATVVQVRSMGPFAMVYVNPADTPPAARKP
jgi:quercetin dioxygenase-like cupin family protein